MFAPTKLHIPLARPELVHHRRALARLLAAEPARLVLVAAPAGAGKTTLLVAWHEEDPRPFAWLSLDPVDGDPVRFWTGVVEALRTVAPGVGAGTLAALGVPGVALEEIALPRLVADLTELPEPVVLVLDDYHAIGTPEVHRSVAFLLDHLPERAQVAIASRSEPPLPLGRLRARDQVAELRTEDLRCTPEQAGALLNGVFGLGLPEEEVARLLARTEGWAAGLQLAALSLRGLEDPRAFIDAFAGDDRQVVDYLGPEALDAQRPELREFLLRTSVLERLSAPLCDAVTGTGDAADRLLELERANLFLVALDSRRRWYRYHQLFADVLRAELARARPGEPARLHRRAADWHLGEGSVADAIHHALAAGDRARAGGLIAEHWTAFFNQGRLATVEDWLDRLGAPATAADARLCVARAWLALDTGRIADAGTWIADAERLVAPDGDLAAETAVLRGVHAFKGGYLEAAAAAGQRAREGASPGGPLGAVVGSAIVGIAHYWSGDPHGAAGVLADAATLAGESANDLLLAYSRGYLALVECDRGDPEAAEDTVAGALAISSEPGFAEHFVLTIPHLAGARALMQRGELERAAAAAERAARLAARGAGCIERAAALAGLAEVRLLLGESDIARDLVARARLVLSEAADPGVVAPWLDRLGRAPAREAAWGDPVSERELAVLRLLATELPLREIAGRLYVSRNTVKTHVRALYRKLGASRRGDAVARAHERGLL